MIIKDKKSLTRRSKELMKRIVESVQELVGSTPLLKLKRYGAKHGFTAEVYGKLEYLNPTGSVKDRAALSMIEEAEALGILQKNSVLIEATSGNTGIALAAMGVSKGYRVILTMPDTMSQERRSLLSAYGAELILTEGSLGMQGAVDKAVELEQTIYNAVIMKQFENLHNAQAHKNTAQELLTALEGKIDVLIAGIGTGGTITGTGMYLRQEIPSLEIIAVEPADSPLLSQGKAGGHKLQGIGANFVPKLLDITIYNRVFTVTTEEAFTSGADFAKTEGILLGISSGAVLSVAKHLATDSAYVGKNIVVILPDSGDRYLSSPMYQG